ncbi:MAG: TldD/PmbA family protein [Sporichthyaceae bacterium]
MSHSVAQDFLVLPRETLADAALSTAKSLGASHADFRLERLRQQGIRLRDGRVEASGESAQLGFAVRVVVDGTWGFAAGVDLTPEAAAEVARQAVAVARTCRPVNTEPVDLAPEPSHGTVTWVSAYEIDPFTIPEPDKIAVLADWSSRLLAHPAVSHVDASLLAVLENKFYADLSGTVTTQQRVRIQPNLEATAIDEAGGRFETMDTLAPPAGRGWEYVQGTGWDWNAELATLPDLLAEKLAAPSVEAGRYDVVIDPTNLWLTIHESIGHATELDRALGYEAAYAGTSFATPDKLNTLQYGSGLMNVTGDRTVTNGLATIGYDDEGVQTQSWDIVKDGVLVGYQLDRRIANVTGQERSNGCAFADSPGHTPIQRMANVSLQAAPNGPSTEELVGSMDDGIYIVGDKSWSIDMQRYNFQFTGQRFFRVKSGKIVGQVRDVAYQSTTTDFWGSMSAVGGPQTYLLGGAFNCGKGQPGQVAAVSHGCPSALFNGVRILNTVEEGGK